jgi:hypothetical protein
VEEILPVWAALNAGFVPLTTVKRWADEQIVRLDHPAAWLLDLPLTESADDASALLCRGWSECPVAARGDAAWRAAARLRLGFLYLRFERGDLAMPGLLNLAGRYSDATECGADCSAFYVLLNEIDGGGPIVPSDRPLAERVAERFAPFAAEARATVGQMPGNPTNKPF